MTYNISHVSDTSSGRCATFLSAFLGRLGADWIRVGQTFNLLILAFVRVCVFGVRR